MTSRHPTPNDSAFRRWFKAQYGKIPSQRRRETARVKVAELETALREARFIVQVEDHMLSAWTNALRGWNARKS